jgi:hypothetical protein
MEDMAMDHKPGSGGNERVSHSVPPSVLFRRKMGFNDE